MQHYSMIASSSSSSALHPLSTPSTLQLDSNDLYAAYIYENFGEHFYTIFSYCITLSSVLVCFFVSLFLSLGTITKKDHTTPHIFDNNYNRQQKQYQHNQHRRYYCSINKI